MTGLYDFVTAHPDFGLTMGAVVAYFVATILVGFEAILSRAGLRRAWTAAVVAGLVLHTLSLVVRTVLSGEMPLTDLFEYTLFFSWAIVLIYLAFFRARLPLVGSLAILIVVFLMLGTSFFYYSDPAGAKMPALKSHWLYIHVSLAALGETFFAIAFVSSLIYLIRRAKADSASLEALDALTYKAISMGFPVFTAGALVAGAVWAKQAWGAYWSWDPKEVLSLVVWFVYAIYLHARLVRGLRGPVVAAISIAGFVLTIFTIFGTMIFGGLHAYG
jgi:ABC-type transport system involved in cytochrome c biogenesis permease subunit